MNELKIEITMGIDGKFEVNTTEGISVFVAIGALEIAKAMLINGDVKPTSEPKSEIIHEEVK